LLELPADATTSGLLAGVDDTFTLERKAAWIAPVMKRHNRMGLLSDCTLTKPGDRSSCLLHDSDNDGLWTSLNVAGETFRYAVQKTPEAKASAWKHFEGMVSSQAICCCSRLMLKTSDTVLVFAAAAEQRHGGQGPDGTFARPREQHGVLVWPMRPRSRLAEARTAFAERRAAVQVSTSPATCDLWSIS
jgi:hypothetical protein